MYRAIGRARVAVMLSVGHSYVGGPAMTHTQGVPSHLITGPNIEAEYGSTVVLRVTPAVSVPPGSLSLCRLGQRDVNGTYSTSYTLPCSIGTTDITVPLDTMSLGGLLYLWQIDLNASDNRLVQRWRGLLCITTSLR